MATYAIGDIQGCYDALRRLLERLRFDPVLDRLWLVGDLVNRGPDSLHVLRFIKGLDDRAVVVLGNHDLHLLALAAGNTKHVKDSSLREVIEATDRDELIDWLRNCPLMHHDEQVNFSMVHAGLPPQWDIKKALSCAQELEAVLRGSDFCAFLQEMYGNQPVRWSESLTGVERLRFITNCLTRLRYCDAEGNLALQEKGPPGSQAGPYLPWFAVPGRATRKDRIIFGHWSTLGYLSEHNVWALDDGCIWGGQLTAIRVQKEHPSEPIAVPCQAMRIPSAPSN